MSDVSSSAQNTADDLGGKVKDAAGLTDDTSLQTEGTADQATANLKQAAGKATNTAQVATARASSAGEAAVEEVKRGGGVVSALSRAGVRSEYAYAGAFASIGLSLASWFISRNKTGDDKAQSDRWGIFIGHWAPTFMALGAALKLEED